MKDCNLRGLYIAHRGIQKENVIENTISAFKLAVDRKIPIELDVHVLKDDSIVVFHDDNLKRIFKIDRELTSYTYDELKKLTIPGTNDKIPLFNEVLDLVSGKSLIVIEIKKTDIMSYSKYCKKILSILEKYPYPFVVKSFDIRIVHWFLKNTSYTTGLLIANPHRKKPMSLYDILMNRSFLISLLKPDFISIDYHVLPSRMVKNFRKKKPVLFWTIRDCDTLKMLEKQGDSYLIEKCYF